MTLSQIQSDTDSQDFTLDQQSYGEMIDYMNTLTPFEAIRYAAEINKMNGFEVVSEMQVREWKKAVRENEKIKTSESIFQKSNLTLGNKESESYKGNQSEIENIKMKKAFSEYQKSYMRLLSV